VNLIEPRLLERVFMEFARPRRPFAERRCAGWWMSAEGLDE